MVICLYCGSILEDNELEVKKSWLTDKDYEDVYVCPNCHHDELSEAEKCLQCGEWHDVDEMTEGYCSECAEKLLESFNYDPKGIYELTKEDTDSVEINQFLASVFSPAQIEEILLNRVLEDVKLARQLAPSLEPKFDWFVNNDKEWFLERYNYMNKKR